MGRKANESDEYIITNTPEATTSFPGRALRENSQAKEKPKPREEKLMRVMSIL